MSTTDIQLIASFKGEKLKICLPLQFTIAQLKSDLQALTQVPPERQKLLNLIKGKLPSDSCCLQELGLKDGHTFMVLGTRDSELLVSPDPSELDTVINDLDFDPSETNQQTTETHQKLLATIAKTNIPILNPLRPGKKFICFDLDHCLFDCRSTAETIRQLMRPGMHELLTAVYPYYDICIWSQTSWRWLEIKLTQLGILTHPDYHVSFVLDRTSMFSITSLKPDGKTFKHEVKPLEVIWSKFPELNPGNTIHIDDLARNFALNPQSGLKISAFKNAVRTRDTDRELFPLAKYLMQLVLVDDFRRLDHKKWKDFDGPLP